MADKTKNVTLDITARDKASSALKNVGKELDSVSDKSERVNTATKNSGSTFSNMVPKIAAVGAGFFALNKLWGEAIKLANDSVKSWGEAVKASTLLTAAIGYKSLALEDYANQLQKVTTFEDDVIMQAQSMVAAFVKDEESIKKVTKAATDLATAKGMDLVSATDLITKSIASGSNALARYGIKMAKTADESERMASITGSIEEAFGGMAEAIAKTDVGKIDQINNALDDYKEMLGKQLTPALVAAKEAQLDLVEVMFLAASGTAENTGKIGQWATGIAKGKGGVQATSASARAKEVIGKTEGTAGPESIEMLGAAIERTMGPLNKLKGEYKSLSDQYADLTKQSDKWREALAVYREMGSLKSNIDEVSKSIDDMTVAQNKVIEATMKASEITGEGPSEEDLQKAIDLENKYQKQAHDMAVEWAYADAQARYEAKVKGIDDEIEAYLEGLQTQRDAEKKIAEETVSIRQEFLDRYAEISDSNNKDVLDKLATSNERELDTYLAMLDAKIISQQEFYDMSMELEENYQATANEIAIAKWTERSDQITGIASTLMTSVSQINDLTTRQEVDNINRETDSKKKAAQATIKNKNVLEKELAKIDAEAQSRLEEASKNEKKIAMIMSIINTAQAVSSALTMKPPPVGIAMGILVGALGAIQTGIIASQAFAAGGIVKGPESGDSVNARMNGGEMVLNKSQQSQLWGLISGGSRTSQMPIMSGDTYIVQGNLDSNAVKEIRAYKEEWLTLLRDSNKELSYRGYEYAT